MFDLNFHSSNNQLRAVSKSTDLNHVNSFCVQGQRSEFFPHIALYLATAPGHVIHEAMMCHVPDFGVFVFLI